MASLRAVSEHQLTLDELAAEINREARTILGSASERIEAAIRIGERLLEAQKLTERDHWYDWLGGLEVHRTTAYRYMRLAKHQVEVRAGEFDGIDPALAALPDGRARRTTAEREEMIRMASEQGMTIPQIAETLGVAQSTVWYWTSKRNRRKRGTQRRATRARERLAKMRTDGRTLSRDLGGSAENAYGLLRRTEQQLDRLLSRTTIPGDARIALRRALGHLHAAEDEIVRAMKLMQRGQQ
jgi:transposase-like protein/chorismate mutase